MPIKSPEEYRQEAKRTRERADAVHTTNLRDTLLVIAQQYESLAEVSEELRQPLVPQRLRKE